MRGAFGKPQGTVARVNIGQVIMSIRSKENYLGICLEALRRAKFKYPGRQKVNIFAKLLDGNFLRWECSNYCPQPLSPSDLHL